MWLVKGQLINTFRTPGKVDRETGNEGQPACFIQLLSDQIVKSGDIRQELVSLKVPLDLFDSFQKMKGRNVVIPCGLFARGGQLIAYIPETLDLKKYLDQEVQE